MENLQSSQVSETGSANNSLDSTVSPSAAVGSEASDNGVAAVDSGSDVGDGSAGDAGGNDFVTGSDKPFLGNKKDEAKGNDDPEGKGDAEGSCDEKSNVEHERKTHSEEEYLNSIQKDESILGRDDSLTFDPRLVKSIIPTCQKYGISPEAAKDMANAFAKTQMEEVREMMRDRANRFSKMNGEARARYSDSDFDQINRGIDSHFKPGGVMNNVIRNSELGSDPEFLALMYTLGAEKKEDHGEGAASSSGGAVGNPDGAEGMSKIW